MKPNPATISLYDIVQQLQKRGSKVDVSDIVSGTLSLAAVADQVKTPEEQGDDLLRKRHIGRIDIGDELLAQLAKVAYLREGSVDDYVEDTGRKLKLPTENKEETIQKEAEYVIAVVTRLVEKWKSAEEALTHLMNAIKLQQEPSQPDPDDDKDKRD